MNNKIESYPMEEVIKAMNEHDWEKYYRLQPGNVFVEAGGFWGKYTVIASLKGCKVVVIEPEPRNAATIRQVIDYYHLQNVTLIEKAVSNRTGRSLLFSGLGGSHLVNKDSQIEVEVDTMDNILSCLNVDRVDLLCCDVEGEEINLIKSCDKYFRENRIKNVALACYHNSSYYEIAEKELRMYGFKNIKVEEGIVYGNKNIL